MNVSASLHSPRIPAGVARTFMVAMLAAFLLGAAGGYVLRGWNFAASTTMSPDTTTHPYVTEPVPYSTPVSSPAPQPTLDPAGYPIPI